MPKKEILIVDDDPEVRQAMGAFLTFCGFDTRDASHGEEAVVKARDKRPDVVLMDIQMPVMDGWDACEVIKKDPRLKGTSVIMVTCLDTVNDLERAFNAGADSYVNKPVDLDRLLTQIRIFTGPEAR